MRSATNNCRPDSRRGVGAVAPATDVLATLGIPATYVDALGQVQTPPAQTLIDLAAAIGSGVTTQHALVCVPGQLHPELVGALRDLTGHLVEGPLGVAPAAGYYHQRTPDGRDRLVISAPAHLPQPARGWGWAVQLYAARSRASWGIGDFGDAERPLDEVPGEVAQRADELGVQLSGHADQRVLGGHPGADRSGEVDERLCRRGLDLAERVDIRGRDAQGCQHVRRGRDRADAAARVGATVVGC